MSNPISSQAPQNNLPNPQSLANTYAEVALRATKLITEHLQRQMQKGITPPADELGVLQAFTDMFSKVLANPHKLAQAQMKLAWDYFSLWQHAMLRAMGTDRKSVV